MTAFGFTASEQRFRDEAREWLRAHVPAHPLPSMDTREGFDAHREWERVLSADRWSVVSWPEEYGGRGVGLVEWLIFEEEYYRAGGPGRVGQNGLFLLAPVLLEHGTDDQRRRWLPPMAAADEIWAQAWSEPESGSDLASLRSSAVRTDGGWQLSGLKTWSSRAAFADKAFGLFRSDPESTRHRGLSYFAFDLAAPGVTRSAIRRLDGDPGFAEIQLDRAEVSDADVIGGIGNGWYVAMATASEERGLTLRSPGRFLAAAERLQRLIQERGASPALREEAAQIWLDAEAYRLFVFASAGRKLAGRDIGPEASLNKLWWSDLDVRLHQLANRVLGPLAEVDRDDPSAPDEGRWADGWMFSLAGPIYAGTNEIQRNIVAERVLGMPR
jgi:alkylation response protein AidB-like acyl-CoA dehydrogenase